MSNLNTAELEYMGRILGDSVVKRVGPASRLAGLSTEDRLSGLSVKDRLSGLSAEEMVPYLKLEDIWATLPEERRQKLMELG